jgi:hypothetical protein
MMLALTRWKLGCVALGLLCLHGVSSATAQDIFGPPPGGPATVQPGAPPPRDVDFPDLPADTREEPAAPNRQEAEDLGLPYVPDATRTAPVEGVTAPAPTPASEARAPLRYRQPPLFPYNPCGPVPGPTLNLGYDVFDLTRNTAQHVLPARPVPPDPRILGPYCSGPGCRMPTCADQAWYIRMWGWYQPYCASCGAPRGLAPWPASSVRCACDKLEGYHGTDDLLSSGPLPGEPPMPPTPVVPTEDGTTGYVPVEEVQEMGNDGYAPIGGSWPEDDYEWQLLPRDLIWHSYLAGVKEPRFASVWNNGSPQGWWWDVALGGRAGILRYGDNDPVRPHGWQLDIEGAALLRMDPEEDRDVMATDYRFGVPLTYGVGQYQMKFAFYHLSSHLGDELMLKNDQVPRYNYSRDVLVWGHSYYWTNNLRLYGEAGWAMYSDVGEPWEFQFGVDYAPALPTGITGAPFAAVNGLLRQEVDYGGHFVAQAGWAWRGRPNGGLFRVGCEYFQGYDDQFQFWNQHVRKVGIGLWYDF